jgi:hypothetical protein
MSPKWSKRVTDDNWVFSVLKVVNALTNCLLAQKVRLAKPPRADLAWWLRRSACCHLNVNFRLWTLIVAHILFTYLLAFCFRCSAPLFNTCEHCRFHIQFCTHIVDQESSVCMRLYWITWLLHQMEFNFLNHDKFWHKLLVICSKWTNWICVYVLDRIILKCQSLRDAKQSLLWNLTGDCVSNVQLCEFNTVSKHLGGRM